MGSNLLAWVGFDMFYLNRFCWIREDSRQRPSTRARLLELTATTKQVFNSFWHFQVDGFQSNTFVSLFWFQFISTLKDIIYYWQVLNVFAFLHEIVVSLAFSSCSSQEFYLFFLHDSRNIFWTISHKIIEQYFIFSPCFKTSVWDSQLKSLMFYLQINIYYYMNRL